MAEFQFPKVDFGGLAELPGIAEEARQRQARRSLGNLKLETLEDFSRASQRALELGLPDEAAKFAQLGSGRLTAQAAMLGARQRGLSETLLYEYLRNKKDEPRAGAAAPVPGEPGYTFEPSPPPPAPPGPQSSVASPSEQMIAAAQTTMPGQRADVLDTIERLNEDRMRRQGISPSAPPPPVPPPGTRLAGPPPTPDTEAPLASSPLGLQPGTAPPAPPVPRPADAAAQRVRETVPLAVNPELVQARDQANQSYHRIVEMGRAGKLATSLPEFRAEMAQFTSAIKGLGVGPDEVTYWQENLRNIAEGRGGLTRFDMRQLPGAIEDSRKEMIKSYETNYQAKGRAADDYIQKAEVLERINEDPRFIQGKPGAIDAFINNLTSLLGYARVYTGYEPISREELQKMRDPVALRELYNAVHGQLTLAGLGGGLSKSISDADRDFMDKTNAGLAQTEEGQKLINKYNLEVAKRTRLEYGYAGEYRRNIEKEGRGRGSSPSMDAYVQDKMQAYGDKNRLFVMADGKTLTDLGRQYQEVASRAPKPTGISEGWTVRQVP